MPRHQKNLPRELRKVNAGRTFTLNLSGVALTGMDFIRLSVALKTAALKRLSLAGCNLTVDKVLLLGVSLKDSRLEHLVLTLNIIRNEQSTLDLLDALKENTGLKILQFKLGCFHKDTQPTLRPAVEKIVALLATHPSLKALIFDQTFINQAGIIALLKAVEQRPVDSKCRLVLDRYSVTKALLKKIEQDPKLRFSKRTFELAGFDKHFTKEQLQPLLSEAEKENCEEPSAPLTPRPCRR